MSIESEEKQEEARFRMMLGVVCALSISGIYMQMKKAPGVPVDISLLGESLLVGAAVVLVAVAMFRALILRLKD